MKQSGLPGLFLFYMNYLDHLSTSSFTGSP